MTRNLKQCQFCSSCLRDHPEEIGLTIYEPERDRCPRCHDVSFVIVQTEAVPIYAGAPQRKREKSLF